MGKGRRVRLPRAWTENFAILKRKSRTCAFTNLELNRREKAR
jgi:hypothetical protein